MQRKFRPFYIHANNNGLFYIAAFTGATKTLPYRVYMEYLRLSGYETQAEAVKKLEELDSALDAIGKETEEMINNWSAEQDAKHGCKLSFY